MALSRTALFYRKNKASRDKQRKKDVARSISPEGLKKRAFLKRKRNAAIKSGKDIKGKDFDHGSKKFISPTKNRGKKYGTSGDIKARGSNK